MLFRSGWNAVQVQMMLGHHSPAFTLATYVHLLPSDLPEPAPFVADWDTETDADGAQRHAVAAPLSEPAIPPGAH
jgi:hypothetical protein